ncbi:hypothetical protein CKO51_00440 [Rhodopirellula sp. SM50]|nr:hypothetical protein CKO51_00440 [Rhodopirellula sp. SM50]
MSIVCLMPNRSLLIQGPSQNRFGRNLAMERDGDFAQPWPRLRVGVRVWRGTSIVKVAELIVAEVATTFAAPALSGVCLLRKRRLSQRERI